MLTQMIRTERTAQAFLVLRVAIAGLLAAHGWARMLAGGVQPFGDWLDGLGFPLGLAIAWGVTVLEIVGTPLLAFGRWVTWLCLAFIPVYAAGAILVHWPAGWFVVGLGRNGMEYSVLLIVCLGALAWVHAPKRATA
jgi:putative oxidoreductase